MESKRDRKRQQIGQRLAKLEQTFAHDKEQYYNGLLHELQAVLATLQQGTNAELSGQRHILEIERDYELTRLRLWEEYQVKQVEQDYRDERERAKEQHDRMIKLIKEKLYDKLQNQIKQLKEDKLLLNLVNANSWGGSDYGLAALLAAVALQLSQGGRLLRKREMRFTTGEADDLSDGGATLAAGAGSGHGSAAGGANGYILALKRRRHFPTRYLLNDELLTGFHSATTPGLQVFGPLATATDTNLSDKDYDALNTMIMHNDDILSLLAAQMKPLSLKPNTRGNKQFPGVQGLKPEELNEDLALLRGAIKN